MAIQWVGGLNKDQGQEGFRPEAIVIHIMEGTLKGTDAWFKNEESGVSAHIWDRKTGGDTSIRRQERYSVARGTSRPLGDC